jgi:hypothetical protein
MENRPTLRCADFYNPGISLLALTFHRANLKQGNSPAKNSSLIYRNVADFPALPLLDTERLRELRQEIAELRKALVLSRHKKGYDIETQRTRQFQRLEEIREELKNLMEWNRQ